MAQWSFHTIRKEERLKIDLLARGVADEEEGKDCCNGIFRRTTTRSTRETKQGHSCGTELLIAGLHSRIDSDDFFPPRGLSVGG